MVLIKLYQILCDCNTIPKPFYWEKETTKLILCKNFWKILIVCWWRRYFYFNSYFICKIFNKKWMFERNSKFFFFLICSSSFFYFLWNRTYFNDGYNQSSSLLFGNPRQFFITYPTSRSYYFFNWVVRWEEQPFWFNLCFIHTIA